MTNKEADSIETSTDSDPLSTHTEKVLGREDYFLLSDPDLNDEVFFERSGPFRSVHWSVAWSDLMMTMFILFMVMFVYKTADREFLSGEGLGEYSGKKIGWERTEGGAGGTKDFFSFGLKAYSKIFDYSQLTINEENVDSFASINLAQDRAVRIVVTGDLLFPSASTDLLPQAQRILDNVARYIADTPYVINVVGHTDNLPIASALYPSNWELSLMRAAAVARYLIAQSNVPARQFYVAGQGEYAPVAPNDSAVGRAKNRRVEIIITRDMPDGGLPVGSGEI